MLLCILRIWSFGGGGLVGCRVGCWWRLAEDVGRIESAGVRFFRPFGAGCGSFASGPWLRPQSQNRVSHLARKLRNNFDAPDNIPVQFIQILSGNPILSMLGAANSAYLVTTQKLT